MYYVHVYYSVMGYVSPLTPGWKKQTAKGIGSLSLVKHLPCRSIFPIKKVKGNISDQSLW